MRKSCMSSNYPHCLHWCVLRNWCILLTVTVTGVYYWQLQRLAYTIDSYSDWCILLTVTATGVYYWQLQRLAYTIDSYSDWCILLTVTATGVYYWQLQRLAYTIDSYSDFPCFRIVDRLRVGKPRNPCSVTDREVQNGQTGSCSHQVSYRMRTGSKSAVSWSWPLSCMQYRG